MANDTQDFTNDPTVDAVAGDQFGNPQVNTTSTGDSGVGSDGSGGFSLNSLGNLIGSGLGIASGVNQLANAGPTPQMNDAFNQETGLLQQGGQELGTGQSYVNAMLGGMSNPQFKQQYDQRNQVLRGQIGSALGAMQNANARSLAMGGPGLINNQDRRDETVSRAYGQGVENAGNQAYTDTTKLFGDAAGEAQKLGSSYGPLGSAYSGLEKALADQQAYEMGQKGNAYSTIAGAVAPQSSSPTDAQQAGGILSGLGSLASGIGSLFDW